MPRFWMLCLAAMGLAAPMQAQKPTVTYYLTQRSALPRDSVASERERLRRLLGLPPTVTADTLITVNTVPGTRCPMPVVVPDTSRIARLPVDRRDSSQVVPMPTARHSCFNPLFRP